MKIRLTALLACACLTAGLLTGCGASLAKEPDSSPSDSASSSNSATPSASGDTANTDELTFADSYADVFKAISSAHSYGPAGYGVDTAAGAAREETAQMPVPSAEPSAADGTMDVGGKGDYSETNVQVQGVDEGDIVKTDGNYIYVLREDELIIFRADGASTVRVSATKVASGYSDETYDEPPESRDYASDIYVTGDTAVVVLSRYSVIPYAAEETPEGAKPYDGPAYNIDKQISMLRIYDITDRANPMLKTELGQDGYVLTTRLVGSTLYMISTYYVYSPSEENDGSYIPYVYRDGAAELVKAGDIAIMPYFDSTSYTVICAYDLNGAALSATQSILGGGSTVYMNAGTLYIAESTSRQTTGTPYTDSVYTVIDYTSKNVTNITSFDITGGALTLKASGTVDGYLGSQFNMDEYDGSLRVVTTTYTQSWTEYTDEAKGWTNYVWGESVNSNALFVLDGSLSILGQIDTLAKDEQVYGVRFDGATGYVVTFRQVDPLFAIDLSDPANPRVLSALKIPGFSEYLHVYADGRLFGLGMDADEETGRTNGMKLTMFNTEDPTNVTVKHSLNLDSDYSVALYNHKAILISPEKAIIAFPSDSGYDIYGYDDETGFFKRASIEDVEWYGNGRGLYIGDYGYIVNMSAVTVLNLSDFTLVTQLAY